TGILYNMKGDLTVLDTPEGDFRYVIGEDLTNDGSMMIGTLVGVHSRAAYSTNGEDWTILPMPTPEQLGDIKLSDGSAAKYISADGKVILGHLGSFSIPVLWIRNDKGEYEVDFFPKNFLKETLDDDRVLYGLSAMYRAMSNNGRYVTSFGIIHDEHDSEKLILCRYDVQEKTMTYFPTDQTIDEFNKGLYPLAVSDDGTIIGTVGMPFFGSIGSFIMEAGQTQAKRFIDVFPDYAKKFTQEENYGFSTPTDISADGRYILGYTFYADDYLVTEGYQCTLTYVIDTKGDAGGVEAPVVDTQAVPEAYYSIDGRRVSESHKGVTIVRMSDGTVRKLITRE
ncbi:MAG: hypothetical protein K2K00_02350, partial [Muribaculaceae bacterium]|nr:hypothetical protein [Muribaculaceae bacterium]